MDKKYYLPSDKAFKIAIIGTGFGGMALSIKLRNAGIEDFAVFERASEVGGTWRDNSYPGCACDVASNLYSFSFSPNPQWQSTYGSQKEIFGYLKSVACEYDLYHKIKFNHEITEAKWVAEDNHWKIQTTRGEYRAKYLISACGPFGDAQIPELPGLENFKGKSFHTLHWDHDYDLRDKNVAVIGTGATAIQVVPAIADQVKSLSVFQRTPTHVLPRVDIKTSKLKQWVFKNIPQSQKLIRSMWYGAYESLVGLPQYVDSRFLVPYEAMARIHLFNQVKDKELRKKLWPDYRFGCKRPVFSSQYYPTLQKDNVELVTRGITEIKEHSVVDKKGKEYSIDTIIFATGYEVPNTICKRIFSADGQSMADAFGSVPKAYLGASISGFPNFFMMLGPHSAAGNQSAVYMLEAQADYIVKAYQKARKQKVDTFDVREDVLDAFSYTMQEKSLQTSWVSGGCESYYQNDAGGNAGLWPDWSFNYRRATKDFDLHKFNITKK